MVATIKKVILGHPSALSEHRLALIAFHVAQPIACAKACYVSCFSSPLMSASFRGISSARVIREATFRRHDPTPSHLKKGF